MGYTSTVEWLLSIGANRHEIAMELAAAAGRSDIVKLLLQVCCRSRCYKSSRLAYSMTCVWQVT